MRIGILSNEKGNPVLFRAPAHGRRSTILERIISPTTLLILALAAIQSFAQSPDEPYAFTTLAGDSGYGSADETGSRARFNAPSGLAVDSENRSKGSVPENTIFVLTLGTTQRQFLEMARKLRVQYPGAVYHVMSRGNRRERIFEDD